MEWDRKKRKNGEVCVGVGVCVGECVDVSVSVMSGRYFKIFNSLSNENRG